MLKVILFIPCPIKIIIFFVSHVTESVFVGIFITNCQLNIFWFCISCSTNCDLNLLIDLFCLTNPAFLNHAGHEHRTIWSRRVKETHQTLCVRLETSLTGFSQIFLASLGHFFGMKYSTRLCLDLLR